MTTCWWIFLFPYLVLSQSVNVTFKNATDTIFLTSMNNDKEYHEWFAMAQCSVISYNDTDTNKENYWLSVGGYLNNIMWKREIMSDIYDIDINHNNNNPNLPYIINSTYLFNRPILQRSMISNNIIQCYPDYINNGNNMTIKCVIFVEKTKIFSNPFIVSNIFNYDGNVFTPNDMFWGFDILSFDDDTFFIAYIESNCLFYTLLNSNDGKIITFHKLLYKFIGDTCCVNNGLFLVKSYFNIKNEINFINSFLLYFSTGPLDAIGVWTGVYSKHYEITLDSYSPILEMQTEVNCNAEKPILMVLSDTCCYIVPYSYGQWAEIDYMILNGTGQRVVSNDYSLLITNYIYSVQYLIGPFQHESNNYFISLIPKYDVEYLMLRGYVFSLNETENKNDPYNQYQLSMIGEQIFVKQWYNNSNNRDLEIYGFCGMLSNDSKHLFLSWISMACYGNINLTDSAIYAQSFNISWLS